MTFRNVRRSGIVGLVLTALAVAITGSIGGLQIFSKHYSLSAEFDSASGLESGDPVRVAGVNVGSVSGIERNLEKGTVTVDMTIDDGIELSERTRAQVRLRTLLGKKYVELADPGAGRLLGDDDRIPLEMTDVATDVDTLLNSAEPTLEKTDIESLNSVFASTGEALDDGRAEELNQIFGDVSTLASTIAAKEEDLRRLFDSADRLSRALDGREAELNTAIDGLDVVFGALAERQTELSGLVSGVGDLSDTLSPFLDRNEATFTGFSSKLAEVSQVLDEQRDRIDLGLTGLPTLVERFYNVSREGAWVNVYLVGLVAGPVLSEPIDLGSQTTLDPGKGGGVPLLHLDPTQTPLTLLPDEIQIPGLATIKTGDNRTVLPPEGFGK